MSTDPTTHVFEVLSTAEHVPVARREALKALDSWDVDAELAYAASLIVTELVTNVVRHAAAVSPVAAVTLTLDPDALTLSVADAHPFQPKALSPAAHSTGGRGLRVVQALADEAGGGITVAGDEISGGKRIVVRLPLKAALPA